MLTLLVTNEQCDYADAGNRTLSGSGGARRNADSSVNGGLIGGVVVTALAVAVIAIVVIVVVVFLRCCSQ